MASNKPVIHGRDHLPGGADPIPQAAAGAWAIAYFSHAHGDAYQSIPNTTLTTVAFKHFETTDRTILDSKPSGVSGDTTVALMAAGTYTFEMGAGWQTAFSQVATVYVNFATAHGPNWSHPSNLHAPAAPSGSPVQNYHHHAGVYMFTDADIGGPGAWETATVMAYQATGAAANLDQMWLRISYLPTSGTETVVY